MHGDELLGVAEVSVSALLSNDGLTLKQWVRVMHGQHEAGQVQGVETIESQGGCSYCDTHIRDSRAWINFFCGLLVLSFVSPCRV